MEQGDNSSPFFCSPGWLLEHPLGGDSTGVHPRDGMFR